MENTNLIDCSNLTSNQVNSMVSNLINSGQKQIIIKNPLNKLGLLEGIKGKTKIEIIGDAGPIFANDIKDLKVIVNGNIVSDSMCNVKDAKFTVFGSLGNNIAYNIENTEYYVSNNCGKNCFNNIKGSSKIVIGGMFGTNFATSNDGGVIVVLNLNGGTFFIDDSIQFLEKFKKGSIYIRGNFKVATDKFIQHNITNDDEDIYLPLISEFARLFKFSLNEITSKGFHRLELKK